MKHSLFFAILLISFFSFSQGKELLEEYQKILKKSQFFYQQQEYDSAFFYSKKCYDFSKKHHLDILDIKNYLLLVFKEDDKESILRFLNDTEKIALSDNDFNSLIDIYFAKADIYYKRFNDKEALTYFYKADSLLVQNESNKFLLTMTKVGIVSVLIKSNNILDTSTLNLAIKHINEGLAISKEYNLDIPESILLEKKAHLFLLKDDLEKALIFYRKALKKSNILSDTLRTASIFDGLSNVFKLKKQNDSALFFQKKQLEVINRTNNTFEIAVANYRIGEFYCSILSYEKAKIHLKEAEKLLHQFSNVRKEHLLNTLESLAKVNAGLQDYKQAYLYNEEAKILLTRIQDIKNIENVIELETKYQIREKQQRIDILNYEKELAERKKTNQRNLLLGGIGISSIIGIFFFFMYRNRQKTNRKLQELDRAKSNFFTNISHEFRTPLTLILGPIQNQLQKNGLSNDERNNFEMMHRNSTRLLSLVDQLLDISKLEAGSLKLSIAKIELMPFIGSLVDGFIYMAKQKELNYIVNTNPTTIATWFDKDVIEKIIVNLLSNAIKYTPTKGSIVCNAFVNDDQFHFEVKNTGLGLSKEEQTKIFERFYQLNENKHGVGIGLALVKELVNLHKGTITVDSIPEEWTTFKVVLPIYKAAFKEDEFIDDVAIKSTDVKSIRTEPLGKISEANAITVMSKDPDIHQDVDNPILLMIDDNADIRTYVSSIFKDSYTILTAKNGQEGIDLAIEHIPDIIISDIMMPVKNGIQLCNTLKVDEHTSHIPIILLTAKAGDENEIEGVMTGADDYITKPFNEELLQLRVQKLIESRKKLQERYSQEVLLRPKDIAITSVDEQFLERLQKVLDDKLVEASFSIGNFSQAIGMSRMQLHRKLKALTGLSATEFIRSQRLKLAAQLLKKSEINVSQVGYSVGFNDHAYFSKCFKEMYHCTPTAYANNTK